MSEGSDENCNSCILYLIIKKIEKKNSTGV